MANVLLIDDDSTLIPAQVRQAFPSPQYTVRVASTGAAGVDSMQLNPPDVVILDLHLPDRTGLEVYEQLRAINARVPVIFVTLAKTADAAIEAMKQGAFDYLFKPLDLNQLRRVVGEALEVARRMSSLVLLAPTAPESDAEGALFGACPAMLDTYKAIGRVAAQDVTVLITGESGTGKELVARAIYQHSARSHAPFLALNCAAIPENLLESELFGHEKGAFTGADRRRIGKFEQCRGGTILLDEIGDMPLTLQAKILRLLQDQCFERVGGNELVQTDVRIIASTHRDLKARAAEEKFRHDLYYRLSVFSIHLAPLRERADDILMLVQHYLRRFSAELGREVRHVAPEAMRQLRDYSWPGNVRELQSVLKQALLYASGSVLLPAFLPALVQSPVEGHVPAVASGASGGSSTSGASGASGRGEAFDIEAFVRQQLMQGSHEVHEATYRRVDRLLFTLALEFTRGNLRDAAAVLGISRQTMRLRLRALGLQQGRTIEAGSEPPEPSR